MEQVKADIVSLKTKVINISKQIGDPNTPGEISEQFSQLFKVSPQHTFVIAQGRT